MTEQWLRSRSAVVNPVFMIGILTLPVLVGTAWRAPAPQSVDCSHCVFKTSFTEGEGWDKDYFQRRGSTNHGHCKGTEQEKNRLGDAQKGVDGWGDSDGGVPEHLCDEVIEGANFSGGRGGRGARHYRLPGCGVSPGRNCGGGGLKFTFSEEGVNELWLRIYMRYSEGFTWGQRNPPHYSKDAFFNADNGVILDWIDGRLCVWRGTCQITDSKSWSHYWSHPSDGSWHCVEVHLNRTKGAATIWMDGAQRASASSRLDLGRAAFTRFHLSNQNTVTTASGLSWTDYDDIAVSFVGRVGCY
jgi:hypothetical protein